MPLAVKQLSNLVTTLSNLHDKDHSKRNQMIAIGVKYFRLPFFRSHPFSQWGDFLKLRIDIFAAEQPKLGFHSIKAYTVYSK